jgi:hypothetical protein
MHYYGEWPDELFNEIEQTASEIGKYCVKWGRISVHQTKEKYGTVRVYCSFGWSCIHQIFYPRHMWIHKWWPYYYDLLIAKFTLPVLNKVILPYQRWIYRRAYKLAVCKRPHLRDEIFSCADFGEALEGVEGYKHSDYWKEYK